MRPTRDVIPDANILQPLIDVANAVLKFFHDNVGLSWGMSIIALTVCTRALLIPLTYKQLKGMRAHAGAAAADQGDSRRNTKTTNSACSRK